MSERVAAAFREACRARMDERRGIREGPKTNPPRHVIKCYQHQIEKALDLEWGELYSDKTVGRLEDALYVYWSEQRGDYRTFQPQVVTTPTGFVVNLGDFQITCYDNTTGH